MGTCSRLSPSSPHPPVPAPETGLGARARAGNPHCRKGGQPGKSLSPPPNSARLLASASEVDRGLRWRAGKRGSLLSSSPRSPTSVLPIALCPYAGRANGLPTSLLSPARGRFARPRGGCGGYGRYCGTPKNSPAIRLLRRVGGGGPAPPAPARLFGNRHTPPRYNRTFSTSVPRYNGEKGTARRGPRPGPPPLCRGLSPPPVPQRVPKSARPARSPDRRSSLTCGI